ncbi:putative sulfate transporter 3.5 [Platanthera zijinensis]|uniref:Sulfate transporter 3.5 n=1 Tax=Platanthera zijinensis TaxID=2320716 RepID=A0AAP0B724_9ASPA
MGMTMEDPRLRAVSLANQKSFTARLKSHLKETFFPDDPFRHFADQRPGRRAWSTISYFVPILQWMSNYSLSFFSYDVLAGITIASLAIPQGISYAKLAEIPPIIGLYCSFVPPLVYAVFGSSNNMAVGNVAAASLLIASTIQESVSPEKEPERYTYTVITAAFFTGLLQLTLGVFRLGIIVDFLARSTITGFMGGTALMIILQQFKGLLGLQHFTNKTDFVTVVQALFKYRSECRWQSVILAVAFLTILLLSKKLKDKYPKLFWVNAISPLFVVILGGLIAFLADGANHGIPILALSNPSLKVVEKLSSAKLIDAVGKEWFFLSVGDAVEGCHFVLQEEAK